MTTFLTGLALNVGTGPSSTALTDRAIFNSNNNNNNESNNNNVCRSSLLGSNAVVLATSSSSSSAAVALAPSPTKNVQSLQAKLLAARKKNELLEEIERGVDSDGYPLCEFRKGFLDHFKGKGLIISTLRVSLTQAVTILASFMSDQLELDLNRNVRVNEGEITQLEADLEAEQWETIEWDRRWKTFPNRFLIALAKYHAVTLILRSYEFLAAQIVNLKQLDKLTKDPFVKSKRLATKLKEVPLAGASEKGGNANKNLQVAITMTQTTLWANLLPFLSDFSLHQGLLCYAYYKYYSYLRTKRIEDHLAFSPADPDEQDAADEALEKASAKERNALLKDMGQKTSRLAQSRSLGWFGSAVGAGVGSVIWAGWGTVVVSALGDSVTNIAMDDGYSKACKELDDARRDAESSEAIQKAQIQ